MLFINSLFIYLTVFWCYLGECNQMSKRDNYVAKNSLKAG